MRFVVVPTNGSIPTSPGTAALVEDQWDDWFSFGTLYTLVIRDAAGDKHRIGGVKIGQFDMQEDQRRPALPTEFERLEDQFFSLGQDDTYYEALNALGTAVRDEVYLALRDVAADLDLFERTRSERVTRLSLLRAVSATTVRRQLHQLAYGNAELTPFYFRFTVPSTSADEATAPAPLSLEFDVEPLSLPPTNVHVLIGRNGVGKTHFLRQITLSLLGRPDAGVDFSTATGEAVDELFANLVSVTFSAFDPFVPYNDRQREPPGLRYAYVGLRRDVSNADSEKDKGDLDVTQRQGRRRSINKDESQLAKEFGSSMEACRKLGKVARWRAALEVLESDPLFRAANISALGRDADDDPKLPLRARRLFKRLSSGHKIVLLTMTRLVELVDERTLVLLDEPEAHLHPPLLAAFVRALSRLLVQRNGVAIIATHSPVILQEVPATCVWLLRRMGAAGHATRPEIETFGENVGVLTREVFGLEVTESGFHSMIRDAVQRGLDFEGIRKHFGGQLGAEAFALAQALVLSGGRNGGADGYLGDGESADPRV